MSEEIRFGTRWPVLAAALAPALAAVVALGTALATGALAVSFVAQSGTVRLTTDGLRGNDFGLAVVSVPIDGGRSHVNVVRIGVGSGTINGLCISHRVQVLGQPFTLLIKGGDTDPSTFEIRADGLLIDAQQAQGVISAQGGLQVNKNGGDVELGNTGIDLGARSDRFGLQASSTRLNGVVATVRDISIPNLLAVPNFRIQVVAGAASCPPPGSGTGG